MSTTHTGSELVNLRNHGGGSFDKGLGIPVRTSAGAPPTFPDAGAQISVNPDTGFIEVWSVDEGQWITATGSALQDVTTGIGRNVTTNAIYVRNNDNQTFIGRGAKIILDPDTGAAVVSVQTEGGFAGSSLSLGDNSWVVLWDGGNSLLGQADIISTNVRVQAAPAQLDIDMPTFGQVKTYLPKVYNTDGAGLLSSTEFIGKNIVGIIGGGVTLVGGTTSQPGFNFVKALGDQAVTILSGSLVPSQPYLLIFGS